MTRLKRRIVELIEALGPIPVSEYMALCLSDPQDGYYMTRDPFGRDGDFITAPEISQMFGELTGVWLSAAWRALGSPDDTLIVEIGPGRGTLTKDMARTLAKVEPELATSAGFRLIETSDRLSRIQMNTLNGAAGRFEWHRDISELPHCPMLIIGNELFDAIPIRQYVRTGKGWRERVVGLNDNDDLAFFASAGSADPSLLPQDAANAPPGAVAELAPARSALMQKIAERIAADGGAGLFIDYGYLVPAVGDTLQAVRRHVPEDVLASPGEADLTAHVDFEALSAAAQACGLDTHATTQGQFLLDMGLLERAGQLGARADDIVRGRISGEVERLAAPSAMGDLFKVLAVLPRGVGVPPFGSSIDRSVL